jgi:membrane protein implicated in regulation of membrane protease activity
MSTTEPSQERTLGQLVASASQDFGTILRGEIALAKSELSGQFKKAGLGGALLAAAGVLAFYSVYFVFITIAEGITAAGLPKWLSYLIVTAFFILIAGLLAFVGIRRLKKVKPKPERAIAQAQQTVAALKSATSNPYTPGSVAGSTISVPRPNATAGTNVGPGSAGGTTVRQTDLSDLGQTARDAVSNDAVGGPTKGAPTAPAATTGPPKSVAKAPAASTAAIPAVEDPATVRATGETLAPETVTGKTPAPRTRAEAKAAQQNRTDPPSDA